MSNYSIIRLRLPDIKTPFVSGRINYSDPSTKNANAGMIRDIKSKYGSQINKWGQVFEIPDAVIIGFIATESGGKMLGANAYKATGLMQVTPTAIWDCARKWNASVKSPLPNAALSEINAKIPQLLTSKSGAPSTSESNKIINLLKSDANFNIMAGTLCLRWLIERFSTMETGGQLNKAMVAYNAGPYRVVLNTGKDSLGKPINITKIPVDSTTLATNKQVPLESRGYLYKMLGKDGFLSLIYIDRVI